MEGSWLQTRQASPTFVDTLAGVLWGDGSPEQCQGGARVPILRPAPPPAPEDLLPPGNLATLPRALVPTAQCPPGGPTYIPARPQAKAITSHSLRVPQPLRLPPTVYGPEWPLAC